MIAIILVVNSESLKSPWFSSRAVLWNPALFDFKQNPILGSGPYTYGDYFIKYHAEGVSSPPRTLYINAHSIVFNILSEMGFLGFAAFVYLLYSILRILKKYSRTKAIQRISGEDVFLLSYLSAVSIHSLFETTTSEPALIWPSVVFLSILLGKNVENPELSSKKINKIVIGIPIILSIWFGIWTITPYHEAINNYFSGNISLTKELISSAIKRDSRNALIYQQRALLNSYNVGHTSRENIENDFENAITYDSTWPINYLNLGMMEYSDGNIDEAMKNLKKAFELAPDSYHIALNYGIINEMENNFEEATIAYSSFLSTNEGFRHAYFFRKTEFRRNFEKNWVPEIDPDEIKEENINQFLLLRDQIYERPDYTGSIIKHATYLMRTLQIEKAKEFTKRSFLGTGSNINRTDAEILRAKLEYLNGSKNEAIETYENALQNIPNLGIYGVGQYGRLVYGPLVFRLPMTPTEIVPEVKIIELTDSWGMFYYELSLWYEQIGNFQRAEEIRDYIIEEIPDFYNVVLNQPW